MTYSGKLIGTLILFTCCGIPVTATGEEKKTGAEEGKKPAKPVDPKVEALQKEQWELLKSMGTARKRMVEISKELGKGVVKDYEVTESDSGKKVKLSTLFGDKKDLIVIFNMGKGCSYCTLWADGINGDLKHLEDRAAVVLASPDKLEDQKAFAKSRGWTFKLIHIPPGTLRTEMGFEDVKGEKSAPGFATFHKEGDKIENTASSWFGPGDDYCSVWYFLGMLKGGAGKWQPKSDYKK